MTDAKDSQKGMLGNIADLEATIYRLNLLCNRFEKDKDLMLKDGAMMVQAIQSLQKELNALAKMRGEIEKGLSDQIHRAAGAIAQASGESVREALKHDVGKAAYRLEDAVDKAERKLNYFYSLDKKRIVWMSIGFVILPVVASIFAAKIYMSDPIMKFNKATCEVYQRQCIYVK
jgi:hypothetical protein